MEQVEQIRRLDGQGVPRSRIARKMGLSRTTVAKYADQEEFLVPRPVSGKGSRGSILDPFKPVVDEILERDKLVWAKGRHTAKRVWERLRDEHGFAGEYSVVQRYVKAWKEADRARGEAGGFNRLEWAPGSAQVDFGEADFLEDAGVVRLPYLVVSFPFSNQGFVQVFRGETAECVCQGLLDVFTAIGGVPAVLVFDNAAGVGRRVGERVREAQVFRLFRLHHRFEARWCNPNSGHEKGNVENKVGWVRRNMFVPMPRVRDLVVFNQALLVGAVDPGRVHYRKDVPVAELFARDQQCLAGLPPRRFEVVRWEHYVTDKYGMVTVDGVHQYSVSPQRPRSRVVVGFRAHQVEICSPDGATLACHPRLFARRRSQSVDQVAMMTALAGKPGAWRESGLRSWMPDGPAKTFFDRLARQELSEWLEAFRVQAVVHGLDQTQEALDFLAGRSHRFTTQDLGAVAGRVAGFGLDRHPDDGPDLGEYDTAFLGEAVLA